MILPGFPNIGLLGTRASAEESTALTLVDTDFTTSNSAAYAISAAVEDSYIVIIRAVQTDDVADDIDIPDYTMAKSVSSGSGGQAVRLRLYWKKATSGAETADLSGSIVGATEHTAIFVFNNARLDNPIGDTDGAGSNNGTASFPALAIVNSRSFVIGMVKVGDPPQIPDAISGTPAVNTVAAGLGYRVFWIGPTASFSTRTCYCGPPPQPPSAPGAGDGTNGTRWGTLDAEIVSAA